MKQVKKVLSSGTQRIRLTDSLVITPFGVLNTVSVFLAIYSFCEDVFHETVSGPLNAVMLPLE